MAAQIVSRSLSEPRQWRQLGPDLEISGGENKNKKVEDLFNPSSHSPSSYFLQSSLTCCLFSLTCLNVGTQVPSRH